MAEFITENPILDTPKPPQNKDTKVLANLREISVGTGTEKFSVDIQKGMFLGSDKFDTAPFRVDLEGNITSTSTDGSGSIIISGAGKNIIVNDGVNDRVLIGFLSGKF